MPAVWCTRITDLFWSNNSLERPTSAPAITDWTRHDEIKIDWLEPFVGLVKLRGVNCNYIYTEGKYYFAEEVRWYGENLKQYRIVYDFWVNEYLNGEVEVKGTLSRTNSREIVLANVNLTVPLIEGGNGVKLVNLEHDEHGYLPSLNFRLTQIEPWISYFDPKALKETFLDVLTSASNKAKSVGIEDESLRIPAILYTSKKFKWWAPLLREVAQHLQDNINNLNVYEVKVVSEGLNYHQQLANYRDREGVALKRLNENRFILIGNDKADYSANTTLSTYKIKELDFSTLKDVRYLGKLLEEQTLERKKIDALPTLPQFDTPKIERSSISNFELLVIDAKQSVIIGDNQWPLRNFKLGEIKDYSQKTRNGQVLEDGNLEVLIGLKDLDGVNWNVDTTHADFLAKHGLYENYPVKKGEVVIPLSKYYLSRKKESPRISQLDTSILEHHTHYFDFLNQQNLSQVIDDENRKAIFGDDWYEREAIAVLPMYKHGAEGDDSYYTYGYLTTQVLPIKGDYRLVNQSNVFITKIEPIEGDYKQIDVNPRLLRDPTDKKPEIVNHWKEYFEYMEEWGEKTAVGLKGEHVYIAVPKNLRFPEMTTWQKGDWSPQVFDLEGEDPKNYDIYKVPMPCKFLMSKFLRDWADPTQEKKWVEFTAKNQGTAEKNGTLFIRYYQAKPYFLYVPHDERRRRFFRLYSVVKYNEAIVNRETCDYAVWNYKTSQYERDYWAKPGKLIEVHDNQGLTIFESAQGYFFHALQLFHKFQNYTMLRGEEWETYAGTPKDLRATIIKGARFQAQAKGFTEYNTKKKYLNDGGDGAFRQGPQFYGVHKKYVDGLAKKYQEDKLKASRDKFLEKWSKGNEFMSKNPITWKAVEGGKLARNPTTIDLTKFTYKDISKQSLPDAVEWFDFSSLEVGQHYFFDLYGTNYLLSLKVEPEGGKTFRLILKDPLKTIEPFKYRSYKVNSPLVLDNPVQIINQFNTLHFFGQEIPLKMRAPINNAFSFERFNITPLIFEAVDSPYEYRYLELKTEVDEIRKVFSTLKEAKNIVGIDQFKFEELKFNHEMARKSRELDKRDLDVQRRDFYAAHDIRYRDWLYRYHGQGQADWEAVQNYQYYQSAGSGALSILGIIGGIAAAPFTGGASLAATALGVGGTLMAGGKLGVSLADPSWAAARRDREHQRDVEISQLLHEQRYKGLGFGIQGERLALKDALEQFKERREIIASTNAIQLTQVTDIHVHNALTKQMEVSDVYLSVNYPETWLLDKLTYYYEQYGYDVQIPNFILRKEDLKNVGANIKFDYIKSLGVDNPIIRGNLESTFINGIRLRDLT